MLRATRCCSPPTTRCSRWTSAAHEVRARRAWRGRRPVALGALKWPRVSCAYDILAVTTERAVLLLDKAGAVTRVPTPLEHPNDMVRQALPLASGGVLTLTARSHVRILDRAGHTKAVAA